MKTSAVLFIVVAFLFTAVALSTCSVNDGGQEEDGDSDCDCSCPDGDSENESEAADGDDISDGDQTEDGDNNSDGDQVPDGDEEFAGDADYEGELESDIEEAPLCGDGLILNCGDSLAHDTNVQGRADEWTGYNCSARYESGREAIYTFSTPEDCGVVLRLKDLTKDIDIFLLSECDAFTCLHMSSTPLDIQDGETVEFQSEAGRIYFVSIDGYDDNSGSYTLEADCSCGGDEDTGL